MPARLTWRNLIPGLIASAIVIALGLGVVLFAGVGRVRGAKMKLNVVTNQARGVMRGTEVWLAGQKIGVVDAVSFRPPTSDTTARVVIQMTVRKRDAQLITRDSRAEVRSGATIISPMVVYITPGTPTVSRVANDDTLRAGAQSDFAVAVDKVKAATQEIDPIMTDARTVLRSVHSSNGTVGALLAGGITGRGDVAELRRRISALRATMSGAGMGRGARSRTELFAEVRVALARADSVRTLIASPNSSFGRFRRDSTLFATIASVRDDLSAVRAAMDSADGTLARVASDSALMRSVADARREMSALFDDLRRRPLRYINLF